MRISFRSETSAFLEDPRLAGGLLGGVHEPREILLARSGLEDGVDLVGQPGDLPVEAVQPVLLQHRREHRQHDGERGDGEGLAHAMEKRREAVPDYDRILGYLEGAQTQQQAREGADDADAGEDARQVLEELGVHPAVDDRVRGEVGFGGHRRSDGDLYHLAGGGIDRFLDVEGLAELAPDRGDLPVVLEAASELSLAGEARGVQFPDHAVERDVQSARRQEEVASERIQAREQQ